MRIAVFNVLFSQLKLGNNLDLVIADVVLQTLLKLIAIRETADLSKEL